MRLGGVAQLLLDQVGKLGLAAEQLLQALALGLELVLLAADLHLLELGEVAQAQFEDRLGLAVREPEGLDQRGLGLVLLADDADHLVDVEVGGEQPLEDMQAVLDLAQTVLETPAHRGTTEAQPLAEQVGQRHHPRAAVQADHVHVDADVLLEVGGSEEMRHQRLDIDPVGARLDHQPRRFLMGRLVAQVGHHGQLLGLHLGGDLLQHLGSAHLVGQRGDHHVALLAHIAATQFHGATTALVELSQVAVRRDDLRLGGKVGGRQVPEQVGRGGLGVAQQMAGGLDYLVHVVRRDVGGHAHGDAGAAVEQHVR